MRLTRRTFLERTGWALTALGLSDSLWFARSDRTLQALAQPTRRKLALLIGINAYPDQVCDCTPLRGTALQGCLTDVELQRELLVSRFGFQASDILTLTDQAATRDGIETAFLSHLSDQARAGDVVVIHFSGLGSRVRVGEGSDDLQNSLVPVDGWLPTEEATPVINDLVEDTLGLLVRSLPTDAVTTILDLSYQDPGRGALGNTRVRSRPSIPIGQLSPTAVSFQEQLLNRTKTSQDQLRAQRRTGQWPGLLLMAAAPTQAALEGQWNGFSAGLFTYALTQQLWWATPALTLRINLSRVTKTMHQLAGQVQQPSLSGQKSQESSLLAFFLPPTPAQGADGVITGVEADGQTVDLWLAGLPPVVIEHYGVNSILTVEKHSSPPSPTDSDPSPASSIQVQVRSRDGLNARGRLCCAGLENTPLQVGQRVWEAIRFLPRNLNLVIAIDSNLERVERVDATSAFAGIFKVSSVKAGEQPADYLFGHTYATAPTVAVALPAAGGSALEVTTPLPENTAPMFKRGYGLFNPGGVAVPNTVVDTDEAVKTAVNRMAPQLRTLLATKLLRLTANQGSSQLGVRVTLEMVAPQERLLAQQETARAPYGQPSNKLAGLLAGAGQLPELPIGSRLQYRLQNYSDRPVYFLLLGIESNGSAIALYPPKRLHSDLALPQAGNLISAGETLLLPQSGASSGWAINPPSGLVETHLIFSRHPFQHTLATLDIAAHSEDQVYRISLMSNPLEVAQAVLQDLHQASLEESVSIEVPSDSYALDVKAWATLSFLYRVIS